MKIFLVFFKIYIALTKIFSNKYAVLFKHTTGNGENRENRLQLRCGNASDRTRY